MKPDPILALEIHLHQAWLRSRSELRNRSRLRGDSGEVSSTVIMIAVLSAIAIAVGAIIATKVTDKAESIPTE